MQAVFTVERAIRKVVPDPHLGAEDVKRDEGRSIRVNSIDIRGSVCDGPGLRVVLYLQGCRRGCAGCHNPQTWDAKGGECIDVDQLADRLRASVATKRLTISGGEPLDQMPALMRLIERLADFDIAVYTGAELYDLPRELLRSIDWIKVGAFDITRRTTIAPFVGSANQRFMSSKDALGLRRKGTR